MKKVSLKVWVLKIHVSGDDDYCFLFHNREDAIEHLYNNAVDGWEDCFGEDDDIDDYTKEDAASHYYEYVDDYYSIDWEFVEFSVMELQDEIAKALGLASHG
jgi:hypothetical protein